jgi:hypothetical protein
MSLASVLAFTAAVAAAQAPDSASQRAGLQKGPPPIEVEVVSVDGRAGTITVRETDTVPARSAKPVELTLAVAATAIGQPLRDIRAGQRVAITCEGGAAVPPAAPIGLTSCVRVVEIAPRVER